MRDCSKWNTSSSDHYLHLVISLAPDEHLDEEQWKDSVNSYLKALSLEEHQCMFTVHQDNDAEHCHILVNKVHPKTHKINNLSYSRRKEQKVDLKLEEKYGFRILNHPRTKEEEQKIKPNTKANDFESQTAQESLYSYVTRIMENSPTINSWENLHIYLAKNGIEIQKYGRGIILKSSDPNDPKKDIAVKGSSIKYNGSTLSLYNLEKRFGKYEPFNKQKKEEVKIENSYKAESKTASNVKDNDAIKSLYEEFQTNKKAYLELSEKVKFRKSQIYLQRRTADQKLKKKHKKLVKAINELYKNDPKKGSYA